MCKNNTENGDINKNIFVKGLNPGVISRVG